MIGGQGYFNDCNGGGGGWGCSFHRNLGHKRNGGFYLKMGGDKNPLHAMASGFEGKNRDLLVFNSFFYWSLISPF